MKIKKVVFDKKINRNIIFFKLLFFKYDIGINTSPPAVKLIIYIFIHISSAIDSLRFTLLF